MTPLPRQRPPVHPGEVLREDYLEPLRMTQMQLAQGIGTSYQRVNELINGKRGITPSTAWRLSAFFDTTPDYWMGLQAQYDLWHTLRREKAEISGIRAFERMAEYRAARRS